MHRFHYLLAMFFSLLVMTSSGKALAVLSGPAVYLLPMACSELLPDTDPFVRFLDSVGRGNLIAEPQLSRRIFRMLALREKVADVVRVGNERNPVDSMVQKTLCFYRQQKEPLRPVPYDDPEFLTFLKGGMDDLEKEVSAAIKQRQVEKLKKVEFEKKLEANREREIRLRAQAVKEADAQLKELTAGAKRQMRQGS